VKGGQKGTVHENPRENPGGRGLRARRHLRRDDRAGVGRELQRLLQRLQCGQYEQHDPGRDAAEYRNRAEYRVDRTRGLQSVERARNVLGCASRARQLALGELTFETAGGGGAGACTFTLKVTNDGNPLGTYLLQFLSSDPTRCAVPGPARNNTGQFTPSPPYQFNWQS
jgi:hypothetical protein